MTYATYCRIRNQARGAYLSASRLAAHALAANDMRGVCAAVRAMDAAYLRQDRLKRLFLSGAVAMPARKEPSNVQRS